MIVWIAHAKVGHRQAPLKLTPQPCFAGAFDFQKSIVELQQINKSTTNPPISAPLSCRLVAVPATATRGLAPRAPLLAVEPLAAGLLAVAPPAAVTPAAVTPAAVTPAALAPAAPPLAAPRPA